VSGLREVVRRLGSTTTSRQQHPVARILLLPVPNHDVIRNTTQLTLRGRVYGKFVRRLGSTTTSRLLREVSMAQSGTPPKGVGTTSQHWARRTGDASSFPRELTSRVILPGLCILPSPGGDTGRPWGGSRGVWESQFPPLREFPLPRGRVCRQRLHTRLEDGRGPPLPWVRFPSPNGRSLPEGTGKGDSTR